MVSKGMPSVSSGSFQRLVLCREVKDFLRFLGGGSPPVDAVLGVSRDSGGGLERSTVFVSVIYPRDSERGSRRFKFDFRNSGSGLILRFSSSKWNSLWPFGEKITFC